MVELTQSLPPPTSRHEPEIAPIIEEDEEESFDQAFDDILGALNKLKA